MSDLQELVRRVERLEAVAAIEKLSADYCHGADLRDVELFLSVWSEDAVWRVRDDLAFTGRDEIRVAIERQWATTTRAFHWTTNSSIALAGDNLNARARFDVRSETQLLDESWITIAGSYLDTYVKTRGIWKLSERIAEVHVQREA